VCGYWHTASLNATIKAATLAGNNFTNNVRITPVVYGSCGMTPDDLASLLFAFRGQAEDNPVAAIVGPPNQFFCDVVGKLGVYNGMPIATYLCVESIFYNKDNYATLMNTAPANSVAAEALSAVLLHFEWKYIVMIATNVQNYLEPLGDVSLALNIDGFIVDETQVLPALDVQMAIDVLDAINARTKGNVTLEGNGMSGVRGKWNE